VKIVSEIDSEVAISIYAFKYFRIFFSLFFLPEKSPNLFFICYEKLSKFINIPFSLHSFWGLLYIGSGRRGGLKVVGRGRGGRGLQILLSVDNVGDVLEQVVEHLTRIDVYVVACPGDYLHIHIRLRAASLDFVSGPAVDPAFAEEFNRNFGSQLKRPTCRR
jgi:hypothetical protein